MQGWCKSGEQCRFIHEQADNDQFSNNVADLVAAGECKFYAKGGLDERRFSGGFATVEEFFFAAVPL